MPVKRVSGGHFPGTGAHLSAWSDEINREDYHKTVYLLVPSFEVAARHVKNAVQSLG